MKPTIKDIERLVSALMETVQNIERAKRKGMASQFVIIQTIAASPNTTISEISQETGLHLSYVTRQIQEIEKLGLVEIAVNPADRRSRLVKLSNAGTAEIDRLKKIGLQRFASFVSDWDGSDVRKLADLLERFERSKAKVVDQIPPPTRRDHT